MKIKISWTPRAGVMDLRSKYEDGGSWTDQASGIDLSKYRSISFTHYEEDPQRVSYRIDGGRWQMIGIVDGDAEMSI